MNPYTYIFLYTVVYTVSFEIPFLIVLYFVMYTRVVGFMGAETKETIDGAWQSCRYSSAVEAEKSGSEY